MTFSPRHSVDAGSEHSAATGTAASTSACPTGDRAVAGLGGDLFAEAEPLPCVKEAVHVASRPRPKRLAWLPSNMWSTTRPRVKAWTCPCQVPVYELSLAGGMWVIERSIPDLNRGEVVDRLAPMTEPEANRVWLDILTGRSR